MQNEQYQLSYKKWYHYLVTFNRYDRKSNVSNIRNSAKWGVNLSSLLIVGNGFDISHGFETGFNQFKQWLCVEYGAAIPEEVIEIPEYQTKYKGLEQYDNNKMATFFYNLICSVLGDDWNDFESALPKLDWAAYIEATVEELKWAGSYEHQDLVRITEDVASQLREMAGILRDNLFRSWARQINISNPIKLSNELEAIMKAEECFYLNFNYTDTLELHYGANNVCHIHGRVSNHDELIIGHAGRYQWPNEDDGKCYMIKAYSYINDICEAYRKDTEQAFSKHLSFFKHLTNITDIYIHGLSFSSVDRYYLDRLSSNLNFKKIKFHLHSYHKKDWDIFKTKLVVLGAKSNNVVPFRFQELSDTE